jgi:hypothetical protein
MNEEKKSAGFYLGLIAKIVLAVAMLLYLGLHSFNFFMFTFKGDQWIFAILGLFTTSIGFILWLAIYLWAAEDGLEKAVSIIMMFVSLFGEFATAGFDMFMNISGAMNMQQFTPADVRNMSYIIAGLALLNGLALVAGVAGQQIMDDMMSIKGRGKKKSNDRSNVNNVRPVTVNAAETDAAWKAEAKALGMWDPNDPNDTPFERSRPELHREIVEGRKAEERPAETPFRKNGQSH